MTILFNQAITRVGVFPKYKPNFFECSLVVVRDFKKKVGEKFLFFPVYETIHAAVIRKGCFGSSDKFVSELKDFKNDYYYFEDDVLYEKPHCTIYMNDKSDRTIYFETVEELNSYVEELKTKAPNIEV